MRNLLAALAIFIIGCSSSFTRPYFRSGSCQISPIIGDGLRSSKGLRVIAGGTCLPSAEDCRQSFLVTITIVNIAENELQVEPDQVEAFDSDGRRVRRAHPDRRFRCRGPLFSPQINLGLHEECTIDAIFAGSADPSRLEEIRVQLMGVRRQGDSLPMTVTLENRCIVPD